MTEGAGRKRVRLAVTLGCPAGIGPEIALLAGLQARARGMTVLLVGDEGVLRQAARLHRVPERQVVCIDRPEDAEAVGDALPVLAPVGPLEPQDARPGQPTASSGRAQLAWIDRAVDLVVEGAADAIVTGPVSKEVIARSGAPGAEAFIGHTEHIAQRVHAGPPVMTFVADDLAVSLVTTHMALAEVPRAITVEKVCHAVIACGQVLALLGKEPARVVVAALNPHGGEGGMFGSEEREVLVPAVDAARQRARGLKLAVQVTGPLGAETAFRYAFQGHYDGVIAMYHDQGTIPMKVRYFGRAVNVTAGLPIVRTSVDHGTAYDIAGTGRADAASMLEAMVLAERLTRGARA